MSIIYEALKKLQNSHQKEGFDKRIEKQKNFYLFFYIFTVILGIIIAKYIFSLFNLSLTGRLESMDKINITYQSQKPLENLSKEISFPEKKETASEDKDDTFQLSELKLSGILYDPLNPFVIINNRILKKGDCIKGVCIKQIFEDRIELDFNGKRLELNLKD
ncbi:MAG: hypothetical protein NC900_04195 [Candidatus Omnitrophica bacterium]|nr:hypothetical protein [Candidatus Omnitrophota bacterium]